MTISIQSPTAAALATLDPLVMQSGPPATKTAPLSGARAEAFSPIIELIGLSLGATGGESADLARSAPIVDAAVASGTIIAGLLAQMREAAVSAADANVGSDARAALNAGFRSGLSQIQAAIAAARVDGVNLLDGAANGCAPAGLSPFDFSLGGPVIAVAAAAALTDPAAAASLADQLTAALGLVARAVSKIADQTDAVQAGLAAQLQSGSALDADAARLAALQVQQQLSAGAAAIANQTPQAILALFR